nr:MAG TPA: hypothetical protein [Caudoviricetes sp.]
MYPFHKAHLPFLSSLRQLTITDGRITLGERY